MGWIRTVTLFGMERRGMDLKNIERQNLRDLATDWMAIGGTINRNREVGRTNLILCRRQMSLILNTSHFIL